MNAESFKVPSDIGFLLKTRYQKMVDPGSDNPYGFFFFWGEGGVFVRFQFTTSIRSFFYLLLFVQNEALLGFRYEHID